MYGPNGFFREFTGTSDDPAIDISCSYESGKFDVKKLTGNLLIKLKNKSGNAHSIKISNNIDKSSEHIYILEATDSKKARREIVLDTGMSYNWYDVTIKIQSNGSLFAKRYAGHIETGIPSKTDPVMG